MKTNYDNPYFANQKMRNTMCSFLGSTTPDIKGNENVMVEDEKRHPNNQVKDYVAKRGIKKVVEGKAVTDGLFSARTRHDTVDQDTFDMMGSSFIGTASEGSP